MKNIRLILATIAVSLLSSCGEGFFNLEPNNEVAIKKIYKTAGDFDIAVLGCYSKLQSQTNFYLECCEYRSDNLFLSAPTAGTQDRYDIDQFQDRASNGILDTYWANFNNGVYRCNLVLDQIDKASFDETLKAQYKAEALFIRAFTYFNMYRIWGGVPVTRKVISPKEALTVKRSTEEQMYDFIAGDMKEIIDNQMLPDTYGKTDVGRVTLGAVQAMLGKVYLTFKKPQLATEVLSDVVGKYSLLPNIASVFDVNNKMNNEVIFAVRFNKSVVGEGHGYWYSITNITDNSGQTDMLKKLYGEDNTDARKSMVAYTKLTGENACLMGKFMDTKDPVTQNVGNDQIILRYADVLLMYAEALNEVGYNGSQDSPALNALNEVHTRSGLTELSIADIADQKTFREAILLERQKEFPYEGHRWFDLVRMGGAKEAIAKQGVMIDDYQFLYPIPTSAIELLNNPSLLWQNPGY